MSLAGRLAGADVVASWPRRFGTHLALGLAALTGAPRIKAKAIDHAYLRLLAATPAALIAIAAAMIFLDAEVAEAVKQSPRWILEMFDVLTDLGRSVWFLVPLGGVLVAIAALASPVLAPIERRVLASIAVRAGFLFVAIAAPSLFVTLIKRVIGRARPYVAAHADPSLYAPFAWRADHASMPSGHAATAFAAAVAIGFLWPRLRAPMLAYALVIAVSRVVLDAHYVSDVIAGAIAGTLGAIIIRDWFASRRLGFAVGAEGNVRAFPGPSWARIKRVARRLLAP